MRSIIFPFICIIIKVLLRAGGVEADVKWYFDAHEGIENEPRCYMHRKLSHFEKPYSLTCYECATISATVLYFDEVPIGAAHVYDCDSFLMPYTLSLLLPEELDGSGTDTNNLLGRKAQDLMHRIQFGVAEPFKCARLNYKWDAEQDKFVPQELTCLKAPKYSDKTKLGFSNGWKTNKWPRNRGVVRTTVEVSANMEKKDCTRHRSMQNMDGNYWLRCFNCQVENVAILYHGTTIIAAATVGTCRSPVLENSITLLHPEAGRIRVQYTTYKDECYIKGYSKGQDDEVYSEGSHYECQMALKPSWSRRKLGWRNGWVTVVERIPRMKP